MIPGLYQYRLGNLTYQNPGLAPLAQYLAGLRPYSSLPGPPVTRAFYGPVAAQYAAQRAAATPPAAREALLRALFA